MSVRNRDPDTRQACVVDHTIPVTIDVKYLGQFWYSARNVLLYLLIEHWIELE